MFDEKWNIREHPENVNLKMFKKCPFVVVQRDSKVGSISINTVQR